MTKVIWAGEQEVKAYSKQLEVEVEGVTYSVSIYWDDQDGYSTSWFMGSNLVLEPESVAEEADKENLSTGYYLELMAEEAKV